MILLATVEVVRPTTSAPLTTAADLAAVVAVAAVAGVLGAALLAALGRPVPDGLRVRTRAVATVAAAAAFAMRLAAGAGLDMALSSRRVLAQGAVLVVVLLLGLAGHPRAGLRAVERRIAEGVLGLLVVVGMVLAGPRAGAVAALVPAIAAVVAAAVVATVMVALLQRRRERSDWPATLAVVVAAAVVGWPAAVQPTGYSSFSEQLRVDGHVLYLTVAPATAGDNEVHLYVFDDGGRPQVVERATITAAGQPGVELVDAGIGHLLAFGLELPPGRSWPVTIEAVPPTPGSSLVTTTEVRADG